jgi:hypothetical protein
MVFLNRRDLTVAYARKLQAIAAKHLDEVARNQCAQVVEELRQHHSVALDLLELLPSGIGFHNASLGERERLVVERLYNQRALRIICCTTTLSAGVNTPARAVVLRTFEQFIPSALDVADEMYLSGEYLDRPANEGVFIPVPRNQFFQILGRAGRPGQDTIGQGYVLVKSQLEYEWVINYYFHLGPSGTLIPRYDPLVSELHQPRVLQEQVLLRVVSSPDTTLDSVSLFFSKTFYCFSLPDDARRIPVSEILRIQKMKPDHLLLTHFKEEQLLRLRERAVVTVDQLTGDNIQGIVQLGALSYEVRVSPNRGLECSCNLLKNNAALGTSLPRPHHFCNHFAIFLDHVLRTTRGGSLTFIENLVARSTGHTYVLDYLLHENLLVPQARGPGLRPTAWGHLAVNLYLYPEEIVWVRDRLQSCVIRDAGDLLATAFEFLLFQNKCRDPVLLELLSQWICEVPMEDLLRLTEGLGVGDITHLINDTCRAIGVLGEVSRHLQNDRLGDMVDNLEMRVRHGIRDDLFDLVMRLKSVKRLTGRRLHTAGFRSVWEISLSTPDDLVQRAGVVPWLATRIWEEAQRIRRGNEH